MKNDVMSTISQSMDSSNISNFKKLKLINQIYFTYIKLILQQLRSTPNEDFQSNTIMAITEIKRKKNSEFWLLEIMQLRKIK